jgi:carboxyl-terminal processing protease
MSKRKWSFALVALITFLIGASWLSSAAAIPEPTVTEIATARSVWQLMGDERYAYLIRNKDEKLALKVVNSYLVALDPQRIIFLSQDVEKFQKKPMWALAAMQGRAMAAPLRVHEIFEQRAKERQEWIKGWNPSTSYARGVIWESDRKDAAWPSDTKEQDVLWQKYMDYIHMASDSSDRSREKLIALQSERLNRVASLPRAEVVEAFVNAFAQTVDPHAAYMTPRNAEDMMITLSHSLDGIGAILSDRDGGVFIDEVVPGGPAEKSGKISVGDRVMAISQGDGDWKDVSSMRSQDAVDLIRGKAGTQVIIRLAKAGNASTPEEVSLLRRRIVLTEAGAKEKIIQSNDRKIGWVKLPGFYMDMRQDGMGSASATKDVEQALERLKKSNVDGVVLDLRDNGGGSLTEAVDLVGLFMPPSDVVQILGSDEQITQLKSTRQTPVWSGPLVVLVNNGSASASEIAAGALQDHGRAIIVGEKTFGKGTVQSIIDLDKLWNNPSPVLGQMKMTVAQFFLPSGKSTQLRGVSPDIEIAATLNDVPGEEQYDNAAPAATIPAVKGLSRSALTPQLGRLKEGTLARSSASTQFQVWVKLRQQVHQQASRKGFPLNEQEAAQMKKGDEIWSKSATMQLKELNMDRGAAGVDPVAQVAAGVVSDWIRRDVKGM